MTYRDTEEQVRHYAPGAIYLRGYYKVTVRGAAPSYAEGRSLAARPPSEAVHLLVVGDQTSAPRREVHEEELHPIDRSVIVRRIEVLPLP